MSLPVAPSMMRNTSASGRPVVLLRPARHAFRRRIEIRHVSGEVGAEYGVADRVERHFGAFSRSPNNSSAAALRSIMLRSASRRE